MGDGGGGLPCAPLIEQVGPLALPGGVGEQPRRQQEQEEAEEGAHAHLGPGDRPEVCFSHHGQPAVPGQGLLAEQGLLHQEGGADVELQRAPAARLPQPLGGDGVGQVLLRQQ